MYIDNRITLLYCRNYHNRVNQLYFSKIKCLKKVPIWIDPGLLNNPGGKHSENFTHAYLWGPKLGAILTFSSLCMCFQNVLWKRCLCLWGWSGDWIWQFLNKLNGELTYDPATPPAPRHPGIYPQRTENRHSNKTLCSNVHSSSIKVAEGLSNNPNVH